MRKDRGEGQPSLVDEPIGPAVNVFAVCDELKGDYARFSQFSTCSRAENAPRDANAARSVPLMRARGT